MSIERTFVAIKPDGVQRGLVGEILGRFERKGFRLVALKQLIPTTELAQKHYGVHKERPFFNDLVSFMCSGACMVLELEKDNAVQEWRNLIGATDPEEAKERFDLFFKELAWYADALKQGRKL